jgi:hypothetical protein
MKGRSWKMPILERMRPDGGFRLTDLVNPNVRVDANAPFTRHFGIMVKPTVPEVLPIVREYYEEHAAGGTLHIVLDDGNVDDSDVQFCIDYARRQGDNAGVFLGQILLRMSKTQRLKLHRSSKR